jgi:hypothetical protein
VVATDQYDESALVTALWDKGYLVRPPLGLPIAIHIVWAIVLLGVAAAGAWKWPTSRLLKLFVYVLSAATLAALAIWIGSLVPLAYSSIWPGQPEFIGPHIANTLALNTEVPAVQMILAGITFGLVARWRKSAISATDPGFRSPPPGINDAEAGADERPGDDPATNKPVGE